MMRRRVALFTVIIVTVAVAIPVWRLQKPQRTLVAHFTRVIGIYPGSDVRVLGVKVGEVVSVRPEGRTVRVSLRYDRAHRFPADAQAVIVPPSIVSDRYLQLTPAWGGGAALPDGADLPVERTAAPLEIDDIYRALDEFNRALGPNGANADGALSDLLATGRANLAGNGEELNATLDGVSKALSTVSGAREDLFGTVANLQKLATALAQSDRYVRAFNQQLADVSEQLAAERDDLAAALRSLAQALGEVTTFVRDNRQALRDNVTALADITTVLARQQRAIIQILDVAPLALSNLNLAYNSRSGTLDTRDNLLGPYDPATYVCAILAENVPLPQVPQECVALAHTLNLKGLPLPDALKGLLGLPGSGQQPPGAADEKPVTPPTVPTVPGLPVDPGGVLDRTLGGILEGLA
jgi:phospholipid/cholesterol/gamma-HCH transport system substrate-binding protein